MSTPRRWRSCIHAGVTPFFAAFIHIPFINVHTRAVASLAAGQDVPQYSFVALQSDGGEPHAARQERERC